MNIATTKTRKVRELIDTETRADIIRKVRENSAIVDGKRRTIVKTAEIAKEFGVRREYVTNALTTLRARDAQEATRARAEEEAAAKLASYETPPAQIQQELIDQFNGKPIQPDMRDVVDLIRSVETKVMLALDRIDRLANRLPAKWR